MFGLVSLVFIAFARSFTHAGTLAMPLFAMTIGYEVFRWWYFGEWVSNTALAKVHPNSYSATAGLRYLWSFNERSGDLAIPAAVVGAAGNLTRPGILLALAFICAQIVFLAVSGGDFMFGYRFVVPVVPCLFLLVIGAAMLFRSQSVLAVIASIVILAGSIGYVQFTNLPPKHIAADNLWYRDAAHFEVARFVDAITSPSDTVLLSEAGIIPFGISARVEDYLGLTSPFWYVRRPDRSVDVAHVLMSKPEVVVLSFFTDASGLTLPRQLEDRDIFESPEFRLRYVPVKRFELIASRSFLNAIYYFHWRSASVIYFEVYVRKDH
jgi:hypothetical protein